MKRVMIVGYYGMGNFGDDQFVSVAKQEQHALWPGKDLTVLAPGNGDDYVVPEMFRRLWSRPDAVGTLIRIIWTLIGLARCDTVCFFGGSVFSRLSLVQRIQLIAAYRLRRSVEAMGVSVGPFFRSKDEVFINRMLRRASRVIVRDSASSDLLKQWDVSHEVAPDLVFLKRVDGPRGPQSGKPTVVAIPCSTANHCGSANMMDALAMLENDGFRVIVTVLNTHKDRGDRQCGYTWAHPLGAPERQQVVYDGGDALWETIWRADVVISARMHGAVAAARLGIPFVLLNYHRKCESFVKDFPSDRARILGTQAPATEVVAASRGAFDASERVACSQHIVNVARVIYGCTP